VGPLILRPVEKPESFAPQASSMASIGQDHQPQGVGSPRSRWLGVRQKAAGSAPGACGAGQRRPAMRRQRSPARRRVEHSSGRPALRQGQQSILDRARSLPPRLSLRDGHAAQPARRGAPRYATRFKIPPADGAASAPSAFRSLRQQSIRFDHRRGFWRGPQSAPAPEIRCREVPSEHEQKDRRERHRPQAVAQQAVTS